MIRMSQFPPFYRWAAWLAPVVFAVVGWIVWWWPGIALGFVVGSLISLTFWTVGYYKMRSRRLRDQLNRIRAVDTEQLMEIARDLLHPDFSMALSELDRRGVCATPSRDSILALLTSNDGRIRGLGMCYLSAFYPQIQLPQGCSNMDPPDVWQERVASIQNSSTSPTNGMS
jgi:hypothetical protein